VKPLAIDLFCGLGGWAEGLLAEGYDVVGFDIERHEYGAHRYPAQLVIQDVMTLHGFQFQNAALIVASPPCQAYSWMAMPWSRAKAKAAEIRADATGQMLADLNRLFDACFRIQAQASLAPGRQIPMVVENVRGAQPWVGRARWNFGSFYLWGDVPALMPFTRQTIKVHGFRFDGSGRSFQSAAVATKNGNDWFGSGANCSLQRRANSGSPARKAASAMIAKIPVPLARHIAVTYR
jgi:C-5 cytosine-specific DNA methylase